jgi:TolB protein
MNNKPVNRKNNYQQKRRSGITLSPFTLTLIIMINVFILGFFGWQITQAFLKQSPSTQIPPITTESQNQKLTSTPISTLKLSAPEEPYPPSMLSETMAFSTSGLMIISLSEAGYYHLYAYHPEALPLTRLTFGEWDDIQPSLSPDGSRVAFASHQDGQWDIHILNLITGEMYKLTNDKEYDGAPSWSGDGTWIAFEKYINDNLDIYILSINNSSQVIRVTKDLAHDSAPVWNPTNSQIAFTSNRSGNNDIWFVDTNHIGELGAVSNFTFNTTINQHSPSWSPKGDSLAWIAPYEGFDSIFTANPISGANSAKYIGSGSQTAWDPAGDFILTSLRTPDRTFLAGYHHNTKTFNLPPLSLSGRINGITWGVAQLTSPLPDGIQISANVIPESSWETVLTPSSGDLYGRQHQVALPDVIAPNPVLNALAFKPFLALRDRIHSETGWDVLSDLENAYVPLSQPLPPERKNDWLYTGRAFALNPILIDLEWMKVVREDFGAQTYWRIYLKTRYQDGSQGKPLTQLPWNFSARFSGSTTHYEAGGALETTIPTGYWVDFTAIALEYGWERHPALANWRSYYQGSRFNTFAVTSGLDWEDAMLQLWPPEIFIGPNFP